jgi:hypothetical protein
MAEVLKHLHVSNESMGSELYLDQNSEEKLVDEKPFVFLIQNKAIQKGMQMMICGKFW